MKLHYTCLNMVYVLVRVEFAIFSVNILMLKFLSSQSVAKWDSGTLASTTEPLRSHSAAVVIGSLSVKDCE